MISCTFAADRRIELYASQDKNAGPARRYKAERLVSYDNGDTWVDHWTRNEVGTFASSVVASASADGLDTFVAGRGLDDRVWFARLGEYFDFTQAGFGAVGSGVFSGAPAICTAGNAVSTWPASHGSGLQTSHEGVRVMLFGKGTDERVWWAWSSHGGNAWDMAWQPIGNGRFTSAPAAACSAGNELLAVFGRGQDRRIWWAFSTSGGARWDMAWSAIGAGTFKSRPAACCSADGQRVYVFGQGDDDRCWYAFTHRGTAGWDMAWRAIPSGVFTSAPAACCSWDGRVVHVFGKGRDDRIWQARSLDAGATWNLAWKKVSTRKFINLNLDF